MANAPLFTNVTFMRGAHNISQLPPARLPEIAFAGRSNVGKSSLLNALTNRKTLARVSVTPGRTRELNFFDMNEQLVLVDMPGYGYARASKKDIAQWTALIRQYLAGRQTLKRVFLLIDSRHGIKPTDREVMALLDEVAVPYQAVLTKLDKIKGVEAEACAAAVQAELAKQGAALPEIIATSSVAKDGIEALRKTVLGIVRQ